MVFAVSGKAFNRARPCVFSFEEDVRWRIPWILHSKAYPIEETCLMHWFFYIYFFDIRKLVMSFHVFPYSAIGFWKDFFRCCWRPSWSARVLGFFGVYRRSTVALFSEIRGANGIKVQSLCAWMLHLSHHALRSIHLEMVFDSTM